MSVINIFELDIHVLFYSSINQRDYYNDLSVILLCRLNLIFVCSIECNCLCLVTISYTGITILNHCTTTLTTLAANYKFYVIALVIPHNSHNNAANSGVFTCV